MPDKETMERAMEDKREGKAGIQERHALQSLYREIAAPLVLPLALVSLRRAVASFQSDNVSHDTGRTEKHAHEGSHIDRNIFVLPS